MQIHFLGLLTWVSMGRKPKLRRDAYGAWLHHLRKERKLTQQALADLVGVPQTTLGYWERTGKLSGREIIFRLAKALGVSVNQLLREKPRQD
jgi:transcriptional regulator with XRE-family HTH domain